jgi:hypothetical protein
MIYQAGIKNAQLLPVPPRGAYHQNATNRETVPIILFFDRLNP